MTDLARALRERLAAEAEIRAPQIIRDSTADDGTRKWLIDAGSANAIEAVYIPENDRGTLCVSSQAGCALDCAFCSTGKQGFNRNLSTGEIVGTYRLQTGRRAATNIGYYSEREFDFSPYEPLRKETIELGRACVHTDHRNFNLLHLLWRGIALYARQRNARFLVGCSSAPRRNRRNQVADV